MKKSIVVFILFVIAFVANPYQNKAFSQCDVGFTPRTVTIFVNGCVYEVYLCVKCASISTGPLPTEVKIMGYDKLDLPYCIQTWDDEQVKSYIFNTCKTFSFIITNLCTNPLPEGIPNCPQKSEVIRFWTFPCWFMEKVNYLGEDKIQYRSCDYDTYCYQEISYCYDNGQIVQTIEVQQMVGTVSCTLEAFEVDVPTEYDTPTECYIYHTQCNP